MKCHCLNFGVRNGTEAEDESSDAQPACFLLILLLTPSSIYLHLRESTYQALQQSETTGTMSASNPHSWSPKSSMSIDDWLAAFPPSTTSSPEGGDGWLWVHGSQEKKAFGSVANDEKDPVVAKAQAIWDEAKDSAASIAKDDSYPTRAKQGQTSKKQARDKISLEVRSKLIGLLKAGSWKTGKW